MRPELPPTGNTVPVWVWKVLNKPGIWHAYPQPLVDAIEGAYDRREKFIKLTVNCLEMSIVFGNPREYANQRRAKNSKCGRFVCKVRRIEVEPTEAQAMMDLPLYDEDDRLLACAICLEYFDNPNHSIERLQCCGQIMHAMCLQVFSYPTIILPPVIAQYLCLGLIPRCSHFFDECVVTGCVGKVEFSVRTLHLRAYAS